MNQQAHKVLLVEDEMICQRAASMLLASLGCHVDVAKTGIETLRLTQSGKYDLIFLDIGLPDMRGDALASAIKGAGNVNAKTPVIILTAHSNEAERSKCQQANVEEFLTKPLTDDVANHLIRKYSLV